MREATIDIGTLKLDCGSALAAVRQRVTIYGVPRSDGSNVVLVTHALSGSSAAAQWWPAVVGDGGLFDPSQWCVVGINALGSCYGSTGPASDADDGTPHGRRFPRVSVGDIVRAQARAIESLGIARLALVIGGSLGGMQALQWALAVPERVGGAIVIGAHDHFSSMGIALNALQREALALDAHRGVRLARKIAMLSYKSDELFGRRHGRRADRNGLARYDVEGYLELQADRFADRMDACTYATLTHAMDAFDVRDRVRSGQRRIDDARPELTFVGIGSDWLFRAQDVRAASERFATGGYDARYLHLDSTHGHDAFLAEADALCALLAPHVARYAA